MIKRILVVNDANDTLEMVKEALTYEHFEVNIVSDAQDIVPAVEAYQPDLLIIDHRLAANNCCDVCRQIKVNPKLSHTAVIICSAYVQKDDGISDCECDAVIAKPFGLQELLDKVNDLIPQ